ncbi:hypothetical protein OEV98_12860 [Caldibacillus lycopersici]|uniref:Uncharacterized protein n=1 Tax=Perspicuibacillus lycopersici TaxID=1325689 RepID=A0AAE3LTS2_9BACI|nr:hypothetical protein [Perspicuibacillus lycopersici]MCU9614428.1 hypothetical protein [Perspicuibacillus lycopersici]
MTEKLKSWTKKIAIVLSLIIVVFCLFYIVVFPLSFLPNGYTIISETDTTVVVKGLTLFGTEDVRYEYEPKDAIFTLEEFRSIIKKQKDFYWLLYSFVTLSIIYFIRLRRKGKRFPRALFDSNLLFSIFIPIIPLRNYLIVIDALLSA